MRTALEKRLRSLESSWGERLYALDWERRFNEAIEGDGLRQFERVETLIAEAKSRGYSPEWIFKRLPKSIRGEIIHLIAYPDTS